MILREFILDNRIKSKIELNLKPFANALGFRGSNNLLSRREGESP